MERLFVWMRRYERHLSALAMVAGFVADNLLFERVDLLQTQLLLASYALACFIAIPWLHALEARVARGLTSPRWRVSLRFIPQFALGGFWSAFLVFYVRSAVWSASWPFLILLFLVFIGSEWFHQYHARLVFTSILFFFALYSVAVFSLPIYTHTLDQVTFVGSGLAALGVFALFTMLLRRAARERFLVDVSKVRIGALAVFAAMNLFYFTGILPPLPVTAPAIGVYHSISRVPGEYLGLSEVEPWTVRYLGFEPTLHLSAGDSLSAYSAVFAPTALKTAITHHWEWYDPKGKRWVTEATITYPIMGGRDGGYRGYSTLPINEAGPWRVDVETVDGRLIARIPFTAVFASSTSPLSIVTLQ